MARKSAGSKPAERVTAKAPAEAVTPVIPPRVHPLVPAFVLFHIIVITLYALPKPSDAALAGTSTPRWYSLPNMVDEGLKFNYLEVKKSVPVSGYLYPTGLWQYWDMFAPDPAQVDYWCDAEVMFLDGTKSTFKYPRINSLSIPEKFMQERHRKFYERVNNEKTPFFWPSFGQAIAFKMATDQNNPPTQVTIIRHHQSVMRHDKQVPTEPPYLAYRLFTYVVDQHKLFADKGWKFGLH